MNHSLYISLIYNRVLTKTCFDTLDRASERTLFYARKQLCFQRVLAVAILSVRLSVCPSVCP